MLKYIFRKTGAYLIGLSDGNNVNKALRGPDREHRISDQAGRITSSRGSKDRKLLAGCIRFLDLEEIKRELGGNWGRASAAASAIIEDIITKNLYAGDIYARHSEELFVLCFANADRQVVEARMRDIVEKIKRSLSRSKNEHFRVAHDVTDITWVDGGEAPLIDTIANSLRQVRDQAENATRVWREHLLRTASIRYKPVWSPNKKVVALHRAVLDEDTGRRTMQRLSSLACVEEMLTVLFELDCVVLGRAASGLHDLVGSGGRTQLIVPINFKSLNMGMHRKRYLKMCADIPSAYRRLLLFEIREIPMGTPGGCVLDLIVPLNQYAHGTIIEASVSSAVQLVDAAGSSIVGVATRADQFSGAAEEANARLKRHVSHLKARNLSAFLHGVNSPELVRIAIKRGIDWMDGPCVADPTRELKAIYRWNIG